MRLIRALFESRDPDFGAILFTLRIGQKLAAVHLHLRGRKTIHGWLIAHDPEFERYSPGILLFQDILRWMDTTPSSGSTSALATIASSVSWPIIARG